MMARYGIPSTRALGATLAAMKGMAKTLGRNHALAQALWAASKDDAERRVGKDALRDLNPAGKKKPKTRPLKKNAED